MSKPKEYSWMTKDKLMLYTFIALLIIDVISIITFGITLIFVTASAVLVAVGIDVLLSKLTADSPLNIPSAAVFGMIVTLSYSLGTPVDLTSSVPPSLSEPSVYLYPALISLVGMVLFKKLQGLKGRKYVNPAAAAKLLVLVFFIGTAAFLPVDHNMAMPTLAAPLYYDQGTIPFGVALQTCYGNKSIYDASGGVVASVSQNDVLWTMLVQKFHGWAGGASSIAVIAVGVALFALCRRYIKWRITAVYLVTVALFALGLNFVYGGDPVLRMVFHLFIGSSIFLAFFMATDPATSPLTYAGQAVFGVGLGVLTVVFQVYMNFMGGSILALVLMNLTSPFLDRVGKMKPTTEKITPKLPQAKQFTTVKVTDCIRCGACMRSCCLHLSPILVKQAFEKEDLETCKKLQANLCEGCGHCSFVCPARIDLKGTMLRAKSALRTMQ